MTCEHDLVELVRRVWQPREPRVEIIETAALTEQWRHPRSRRRRIRRKWSKQPSNHRPSKRCLTWEDGSGTRFVLCHPQTAARIRLELGFALLEPERFREAYLREWMRQ